MTKKELDFFRSILLEKRKFTMSTVERLKEMSQIKDADNNEKYTSHIADQASDTMEKEEMFYLLSRELTYLSRIESTLKSIELGKYGICKICNQEIPHERLEAVPTTDTCVSCKNKQVIRTPSTDRVHNDDE